MTTDSQIARTDDIKPIARRRILRLRWIVLMIVLLSVLWMSRFAYLRLTLVPTPRPEYWEAKIAALDPPGEGTLAPSEVMYLLLYSSPWKGNAAVDASRTAKDEDFLTGPWDADRPAMIAAESVFTSDSYHDKHITLREALEIGWTDHHALTTAKPSWGWFRAHRTWAYWLTGHSRWAREQGHPIEETVHDWIMAMKLQRQTTRTRQIAATNWSLALSRFLAHEMVYTSREPHSRIDTLAFAKKVNDILGPVETLGQTYEGERLRLHSFLEQMYVRDDGNWLAVSHTCMAGPYPSGTPSPRLWNLASPLYYDLATARRCVDDYFTALDTVDCIAAYRELTQTTGKPWSELRPNALGGFRSYRSLHSEQYIFTIGFVTRTETEAALAMLALAEFHREHGHYPDQLGELVPNFLPQVPVDYGDRKPLRYRRIEDDYLLYSVFEDGVDNGGEGKFFQNQWRPEHGGPDAVFSRMRRPGLRK